MPEDAPSTIIVCINRRLTPDRPSCAARGSEALAEALEEAARPWGIPVTRLKCFGRCDEGPNVRIRGGRFFRGAGLDDVAGILACARGEVPDPDQES